MLLSPEAIALSRSRLRQTSTLTAGMIDRPEPARFGWNPEACNVAPLGSEQILSSVCMQCRAVPCTCREPPASKPAEVQGLAHIRTGKLEGAVYAVAVPVAWNGQLLLYLHGTRPHGAPLVAELDVFGDEFRHLLANGWMVAATSYRSHGLVLSDALVDALNLRLHLSALFGEPAMVVVEGRSMGGTAAILLAERHPDMFTAVVTVGAALLNARLALGQMGSNGTYANEEAGSSKEVLANRPLIPLILAVNESEVSPARSYVRSAWDLHNAGDQEVIVPALWEIKRPGHNWLSDSERLNAVLHAASWVAGGTFITRRGTPALAAPDFEPTHMPSPTPEGMYTIEDKWRATGAVASLTPTGAFVVSIPRHALAAIGVRHRCSFRLYVDDGADDPLPVRVTLDEYPFVNTRDYSWCAAFEPTHEWLSIFVRTYEYCNAARLLQLKLGMTVRIEAERPTSVGSKHGSVVKAAQQLLLGCSASPPLGFNKTDTSQSLVSSATETKGMSEGAASLQKGQVNGKHRED